MKLSAEGGQQAISDECTTDDVTAAAASGDLEAIRLLRTYGIHCMDFGNNRVGFTANPLHTKRCYRCSCKQPFGVIQDLRMHGI